MTNKRELLKTLSLTKLRKLFKEKDINEDLFEVYWDEEEWLIDKLSRSRKVKIEDVKKYLTKANLEKYFGKKTTVKKTTTRTTRKKFSRAVEKAIWDKYKHRCAICGVHTGFSYGEIDHIKPLAKGGSNSVGNLQWLCHRCNKLKGSRRTNTEVKKLIT